MRKLKLFFACALMSLFSLGQVWADVESGTTYSTPSAAGVPTGWTSSDGGGTSYVKLTESTHYISTEEFCQNGFTSIVLKARKFGGPSAEQLVITVEWIESGESPVVLGTVSPTGTSLTNYTISSPATVTGNKAGAIKISCKGASGGKGSGVSEVTINYTEGTCGGGTPTCATPTFSPTAGSYEGTQNVTITSTTGSTIYYTTDGTDPKTSGTKQTYSAAVTVAADMTLKAYAVKAGSNDSEVGTAAYVITEGPDVTLNLIDGNWGFPTSNTTGTETYTNSATGYSVTCYAPTNYKVSGSTYFYLGKSGAYIELPSFSNPIEKIVVTGNSGASTSVIWNIFKGDDAVSTAATGCAEDSYTFNIAEPEANVVYTLKVTSAHNLQIKAIKIFFGAAPAVAKPTISGDENFVTSTTVTISHADADAIYYTTDGSDPKTSGTKQTYSVPFTVNADGTTTVKAYAVKGSDESAVAEKTFTKVDALESLAALLEATTSTETAFNVVISNWVVTGVNGSRAWIADAANEKGILLYKSGHNFVAGNKLNGVVLGTKTKLYQGYPEMTALVSTDVTVTTAETVTPRVTTIAALTSGYNKEQGTVVKLENLTYTASSATFSDGVNTLALNTQLYNPSMVDGAIYTVIGVVRYDNEAAISIMPRSVDDVEQTGGGGLPEVDGLAALKAEATGASYLLTLENAVVTLVDGSNAFIEDATAGALIYKSGHGFSAGDKLNGQYEVTTATYQGKFEITAIAATTGTKTTGAEIPVTTLTIAQLNANFAANESKRIKIVGVNVTDAVETGDATARTGEISDGANAIALYAGKSGVTAALNDNIDVIGYPTYHNTDEQLAVWAQADITVNEKEDPELAYNPAVVNVLLSDLASFTPAVLEYATAFDGVAAITYESSDPSIATVETDGTVTLVATAEGSTTITATFSGNATYKADNASYTINVSAAPIAPVYTMSFDMTRASYDAAADAQVVWNSSVVTMTANKNDGTKVTNYLAGNYSGTTLIAETRLYAKNSISFVPQAGVTITKIEWMSTAKGYATKLAAETFVNATAVVDGTDDKLVIITPSAAGEISVTLTDAARATGVTVYYQAESEKAKLAASIAIANINMAVGDDDILLSDIAATSNPNKKAISYAITSGSEYVSITGEGPAAAFHALAEGTATITATIPNDLGNYTGATTTFDIIVAAAPVPATLLSIAISGTASVLEYTEGQDFNPAGLVVTGHYSDGPDAEITEGITWAFDPSPLTEGTTSVSVTATVETISSDAFVVNGLTVGAPAPVGDNYVKVTASQTDWSGDYILVYEDGTDAYVWNGDYSDGASNYASATISSNTIAKPATAAVITIAAASEGKYTLQVNGDKYFQDNGSNSKLIFTDAIADAAEVTISYEADWTKLLFSERCIRFNNASGQTRFRFYAANSQQAVQLYKKETPEPPTPVYETVRSGLTAGKYYTICYPKAMTDVQGATLWSFVGKDANFAYIEQETATTIEAGKPYIMYATASTVTAVLGDETNAPGANGAIHGTFSNLTQDQLNTYATVAGNDLYLVIGNELRRATGTGTGSNTLPAQRAFVVVGDIPAAPAHMPAHVRAMPMHKDAATGLDALDASEKPVKMVINGQLFILRGEKLYDATGRLVK